jgi:protein-disulfide isomerase
MLIRHLFRFLNKTREWWFACATLVLCGIIAFELHDSHISAVPLKSYPTNQQIKAAPPNEQDIFIGSLDAAYKVIIYTDYECPFCRDVDEEIPRWIREYGTSTIAFHLRHLPLTSIHPNALAFAKEVECVKRHEGNEVAFQYGKWVYDMRTSDIVSRLKGFKETRGGFEEDPILECVQNDPDILKTIQKHSYEALLNDVKGTPSLFIFNTARNQYIARRFGGGAGVYDAYFKDFFGGEGVTPQE